MADSVTSATDRLESHELALAVPPAAAPPDVQPPAVDFSSVPRRHRKRDRDGAMIWEAYSMRVSVAYDPQKAKDESKPWSISLSGINGYRIYSANPVEWVSSDRVVHRTLKQIEMLDVLAD